MGRFWLGLNLLSLLLNAAVYLLFGIQSSLVMALMNAVMCITLLGVIK
jgi:hypothetical protein